MTVDPSICTYIGDPCLISSILSTASTPPPTTTLPPSIREYLIQIQPDPIIVPTTVYERLDHRREHLCKKMYNQICQKDHKLNYLIPAERNVTYNLRRSRQLVADKTRVKRTDKSFINYCINKYNN